jgi:REP element-mobilizing transposase RayT
MSSHRRNLPHYYPTGAILFVTWQLFGSRPESGKRVGLLSSEDAGKQFVAYDNWLDRVSAGPFWLADPRIAAVVSDAIARGEGEYRLYELHAWVIMPNHVHLVLEPKYPLPRITRWLKGSTARASNLILDRVGFPFWQYESYDHCVRSTNELKRITRYVESNPVKAGLSDSPAAFSWSSASAGRRPALQTDQE